MASLLSMSSDVPRSSEPTLREPWANVIFQKTEMASEGIGYLRIHQSPQQHVPKKQSRFLVSDQQSAEIMTSQKLDEVRSPKRRTAVQVPVADLISLRISSAPKSSKRSASSLPNASA